MKIALINEASQCDKNDLIFNVLKSSAEPLGHNVFNYGMYSNKNANSLNYVNVGILTAILLNSGAADFVVTGCGTGEGVTISTNSFPGVQCGLIQDPTDAYLFLQINNGNAVSLPFSKGCGMGLELNLKYTFDILFGTAERIGYPQENGEEERKCKELMDKVKEITHMDMLTILDNLPKDTLIDSISTKNFKEYFYSNATNDAIKDKIKDILNDSSKGE